MSITLNNLSKFINHPNLYFFTPLFLLPFLPALAKLFFLKHSIKVFLVDFACYKPPPSLACSRELVLETATLCGTFSEDTLDFMKKTLERSGLGDSTYLPEALLRQPRTPSLEDARREAEMVVFGSIDMLLAKTRVKCKEIGIIIVNCSIFNVVPSVATMIVNRYKLRDDIKSYNLGGMGCSAGLKAIGLAEQLLKVHRNTCALVVSTEIISDNCYFGNDRSKCLINCLFRVGGSAILLSNRLCNKKSSNYELLHSVHTHAARSDRSYNSIILEEDNHGRKGITVTKDLLAAAIDAIESNLTNLGHLILPASEKFKFVTNHIRRKLFAARLKPYAPNFSKAVNHFFSHVGGKPVLDELQKQLGFSNEDMEASRMTLFRFGNTSSSSVWYELAYAEAMGRMKMGDRVWQLAFGSGFKCSSVVWRALRTVDHNEMNPWSEEIDNFPIDLDNCGSIPYYFEPSK